ncbi:MAG: PAS domain-containing protein [Acidobacteria bacterium]|nr:PAS domain-containing protein [Acidobacteriota bacterium]
MTAGMAAGVTAVVVIACAGGAYVYSQHHMRSLLETARNTALAEGDLIRVALEHQMIENDRTLIADMVQNFGRQARVERLAILDRTGKERYASGTGQVGDMDLSSPTCQACHRYPAAQRGSSRVIETRGGTVLRTVVPIRNREACYGCHDPSHKINGILILDIKTDQVREAMTHDLRWLVGATALITLLLVGAIGLVVRVAVLRRLQRFETAARQIAAGDLGRRIPVHAGSDIISWLEREFNTLADSVAALIGEVRTQRERLETVINSIDDGIVVLDTRRNILAANDAFLARVEHSRHDVLGCCCRGLQAGGCNVGDCPTLACLASGGRQVRICERRTAGGKVVWEEVHASPIRDAAGNLQQVVEVWRDISERRAAEAHLAEAHRLASVGTLASGFSHELNTPLATVLTCVEGILRESASAAADGERIRENAAIAREQVLRCRSITQHFLRMARGQRSQGDVVDVEAVIRGVARLIEPTAREHGVRVEVRPMEAGTHVRAEEAEFEHTLINLLLNAIQACRSGGKVAVEVEAGDEVRIRVRDNGCGIPPENQARIFDPFFSARQGGTGLGLFLSLHFVRRWKGDLTVESTPGQGSTFEIVMPALVRNAERELVS